MCRHKWVFSTLSRVQAYLHVDFPRASFTEEEIDSFQDRPAQFYVKDEKGQQLVTKKLPLWFEEGVKEL